MTLKMSKSKLKTHDFVCPVNNNHNSDKNLLPNCVSDPIWFGDRAVCASARSLCCVISFWPGWQTGPVGFGCHSHSIQLALSGTTSCQLPPSHNTTPRSAYPWQSWVDGLCHSLIVRMSSYFLYTHLRSGGNKDLHRHCREDDSTQL